MFSGLSLIYTIMTDCKTITSLKTSDEELEVEYEIISNVEPNTFSSPQSDINKLLADLDDRLAKNQAVLDDLNSNIDRLTNHADGFDYAISACSGVLCGFIDSFFVGEFNFDELKADSNKHVNKFVEKYAKLSGWDGNGRLKSAVEFLEKKFPVDQDNVWKAAGISSTRLHHLEDLAHHPTPCGLFFAILVSFFRCAVFVDKGGEWHFEILETDKKKLAKLWIPILVSGILRWMVYVAESKYLEIEGKELPKPISKLLKTIAYTPGIVDILKVSMNWFGHLVSDMAGSKQTAGGGMGVPGLFLSLLKELSSLPYIKDTNLPKIVSDWYSKDKIDMRAELAIVEYAGRQSIPVILNECIVRTFFFVRHLIEEKKNAEEWEKMNWNKIVPWGNRTINRMLTIATGTFTTVDVADAAIRSVVKNDGNVHNPKLYADFVLRINFVGLGRFAIAVGTDIHMGAKREKLRKERMFRQSEQLLLGTTKVFYKQADMWISAKETSEAIDKMEETAIESVEYMKDSLIEISSYLSNMTTYRPIIEENNPGLLNQISDILKYGI